MQVSVPAAGLVPIASVTVALLLAPLVTVLPPRSWTATIGWIANAWLLVAVVGWAVKPSFAAAPGVTATVVLSAEERSLAEATITYGFEGETGLTLSILQPANVATPATTVLERPLSQVSVAPVAPVPDLSERVDRGAVVDGRFDAPARTRPSAGLGTRHPP